MTKTTEYLPRCFFDIDVGDTPSGRIIFELFSDQCPVTCENFRSLCTGEKGLGKTTGKALHYKAVTFHRIVKDFMIQGGDFSAGNGTGGESIFGGTFKDESFDRKHDQPFLLSMANRGKDSNGSQFFVTTKPAPHLDGVHVVFGHVISGHEIITDIESLETDANGRPNTVVRVGQCGELIPKFKLKKKKYKKEKKHKKNEISDVSEKKHKRKDISDVPEKKHKEKDILDVADDHSFLFRRSSAGEKNDAVGRTRSYGRTHVSRSGRKMKGRGVMRFRTPSRSRSRSITPPHWRHARSRVISLNEYQKFSDAKQREDERKKLKGERYHEEKVVSEEHRRSKRKRREESEERVSSEAINSTVAPTDSTGAEKVGRLVVTEESSLKNLQKESSKVTDYDYYSSGVEMEDEKGEVERPPGVDSSEDETSGVLKPVPRPSQSAGKKSPPPLLEEISCPENLQSSITVPIEPITAVSLALAPTELLHRSPVSGSKRMRKRSRSRSDLSRPRSRRSRSNSRKVSRRTSGSRSRGRYCRRSRSRDRRSRSRSWSPVRSRRRRQTSRRSPRRRSPSSSSSSS